MKQLNIFADCTKPVAPISAHAESWHLFIDGASRKNPGLAGAGFSLKKDNEIIKKRGFYLGRKTNNQAEYLALLLGIFFAKKVIGSQDILYIMSDSELLTKQMRGEYRVRDTNLAQLHRLALLLLAGINYSFCHIFREYNQEADALANEGIDKKKDIPNEFLKLLEIHDIKI